MLSVWLFQVAQLWVLLLLPLDTILLYRSSLKENYGRFANVLGRFANVLLVNSPTSDIYPVLTKTKLLIDVWNAIMILLWSSGQEILSQCQFRLTDFRPICMFLMISQGGSSRGLWGREGIWNQTIFIRNQFILFTEMFKFARAGPLIREQVFSSWAAVFSLFSYFSQLENSLAWIFLVTLRWIPLSLLSFTSLIGTAVSFGSLSNNSINSINKYNGKPHCPPLGDRVHYASLRDHCQSGSAVCRRINFSE